MGALWVMIAPMGPSHKFCDTYSGLHVTLLTIIRISSEMIFRLLTR